MRQRKQFVQIDLFSDGVADLFDFFRGGTRLVAGHQAKMPFDNAEPLVVMDRADYRHIRIVLDDRTQFGLVAGAAQIIEYHTGYIDVAVECLVTEYQRRDAACHAARIDHQEHRQTEQLRQGGVAVAAVQRKSVIQALVAFYQIHFSTMPRESGGNVIVLHQIQIKVAAGASGCQAEPHRIDVIGTFLERLDRVSAFAERGTQACADHRFSGRLVRRRNQ